MTLDLGSPFKVSTEPYVIAAVAQAQPTDAPTDVASALPAEASAEDVTLAQTLPESAPEQGYGYTGLIAFFIVLAVVVGLVLLIRRGQAQKG